MMSFSGIFIRRPRLALVLSIVLTLAGVMALLSLPVKLYPDIAPTRIQVAFSYPGASAKVLEEVVVRPLEEQINGVEGMDYIESSANSNGFGTVTVTFGAHADADMAQIYVQNRVARVAPKLPQPVRQGGLVVSKRPTGMLLGINLHSTDSDHDALYLSHYADRYIKNPLSRIAGVSSVEAMGAQTSSIRIWLQPDKMQALQLTVTDVKNALAQQSLIATAGVLGQGPTLPDQQFEYTITSQGRLRTVEQFGEVVLRVGQQGGLLKLRDVARIEQGAKRYGGQAQLDDRATAFLALYQLPSANALQLSETVRSVMHSLADDFPEGLQYDILYDTTTFIERSVAEVVLTLIEAVALVVLVVFLFLQNWRMTLIPAIAIPVSLVGTFAVMAQLGYSINTLTLFGLVLAIGIVVDDAIVVIESVEHHIRQGLAPKEATGKAMKEVTLAIITTTLVLLAVFVPVAFMPGMSGILYRQFSVTICVAVLISSFNALTLSPALCALLLKPNTSAPLALLAPFERFLARMTQRYGRAVTWVIGRSIRVAVLCALLVSVGGYLLYSLPAEFVPDEDQGYLLVNMQLPDAASINRTDRVVKKVHDTVVQDPDVTHFISVSGYSFLGGAAANNALGIVLLRDWDERQSASQRIEAISARLQGQLWSLPEAQVLVFSSPPIPGLGTASGFDFRLKDNRSRSADELRHVLNSLIYEANGHPELQRVSSTLRTAVPQYQLDIDRDRALAMGVSLPAIFTTLQAYLSSLYINDTTVQGVSIPVLLQAESSYRNQPVDLYRYTVRSASGDMVPLSTVVTIAPTLGPTSLTRFNMARSATVTGSAAPGASSGDAVQAMTELADKLPDGYSFEWAGQTREAVASSQTATILLALSILFAFLFLVAQYESWTLPLAVIASVPLTLAGAGLGLFLIGSGRTLYAQTGMVLLIGVAAKTAILIVEFAIERRRAGLPTVAAAIEASRLRFRAVLMTSVSFILGMLPLLLSSGPGAASRINLGVTVLSGMVAATLIGIFLTPVMYSLIQTARERVGGEQPVAPPAP